MKTVIRMLLIVLLAIVIAVVGFGIYIFVQYRPFFRHADFDQAALQAQIDQYAKLYEKIVTRPDQDEKQLTALLDQMYKDKPGDQFVWDYCDPKEMKKLDEFKPKALEFEEKYLKPFEKIVDDGLVLHMEAMDPIHNIPEIMNYRYFRTLIYRATEIAALAAMNGDSTKARQLFETSIKAMYGMYETPMIINTIVAASLNKEIDRSLIYAAPKMETEDLQALYDMLAKRPDPLVKLVDGYKTEALFQIKMIDQLMSENNKEEIAKFAQNDKLTYRAIKLMQTFPSIAQREKLVMMNYYVSTIHDYEKWLGNRSAPIPDNNPMDDPVQSLWTVLAVPNLKSLTQKVVQSEALNVALVKALQKEIQQRKDDKNELFVIRMNKNKSIEMGVDHGCIRKK